ncbi:MAG: GTP diphosphokinase [Pseudomonadales bacterium]|nr:GTP diphosphokinase [Pseudomonadales bacterium]
MVQVRDEYPLQHDGGVDIAAWIGRLPIADQLNPSAQALLEQAAFTAQQYHGHLSSLGDSWGERYSCFYTGLEMAELLADLNLDVDTLSAALLYRAVRDGFIELAQIQAEYPAMVAKLIGGVLQMAALSSSDAVFEEQVLGSKEAQPEHMRKMLVAMVDDVRVALIKLAERTCAIREVKNNASRRHKVAKEVFEVYAPLAHRLGIGHIKWELEDLSFRYLHPDEYKRIAHQLDERRLERQQYIDNVIQQLDTELIDARIEGQVNGRVKHIYSIWRKMQRKKLDFSQIYDIRAVRILVKEIRDCYTVLGIVHTLWRAIPNEFDDYIALPKENGYRSLHTAVFGEGGKVVEIQIRTFDMHEEAEFGVCAHWQYKGADAASSAGYEEKIAWLKQVLDEQEEDSSSLSVELEQVKQDKIYVFTPQGHVVELSQDATPLDFAYRVHTEIGHRTRGAKVNGRIVPLTHSLENGQQVEVITGSEPEPSREWLRPTLGYIKTSRARAKVKAWFKKQDRSKNIATGKALLDKEFKRLALTGVDVKVIATELGFAIVDDMYASVGAGDKGTGQIVRLAQQLLESSGATQFELSPQWHTRSRQVARQDNSVEVSGTGNMLTQMASCCQPVLGDDIGGFVTVGRGVSVHRQDCPQFLHLCDKHPERIIEVSFAAQAAKTWPVDIAIVAYDRPRLLSDITSMLANEKVNVLAIKTLSNTSENTADMQLTIEVEGIDWLSRIMAKISHMPNIISVNRLVGDSLL